MEELPFEKPFLRLFGPYITRRLAGKLYDCQNKALNALVKWFTNEETSNKTAMVVMPTGSGKTGVICCLPYVLGDAVENHKLNLDLKKPMLVIAPSLEILNQLEDNLKESEEHCFLSKVGIINDKELRALYRVQVVQSSQELLGLRYAQCQICLLYTSPSPRDATLSRMPSSA